MPHAMMTDYFPTARVEVAFTPKELKKLCKKHGVVNPAESADADAETRTIVCGEGLLFIVRIDASDKGDGFYQLVAHEATHMASHYMEYIHEDSPSREFMAYTVQAMMCALLGCIAEKERA